METKMEHQYRDLGTLIEKFGVRETIPHKFLELRARYPLFNRLCSQLIVGHIDSSEYSKSYVASWDSNGRLIYFNPNPNYPQDFVPIDSETKKPIRELTAEEFKERSPTEFAHSLSQILTYEER